MNLACVNQREGQCGRRQLGKDESGIRSWGGKSGSDHRGGLEKRLGLSSECSRKMCEGFKPEANII